ncbi:PREDICTED: monosaccharide-sensing protein 2-like [Erythranthe guttata]|uniref:monosaccharide-sensing protein 2-like n=1 Tax=Erythranthe guttata TaxID=4155 RepID=UPI00064D9BD4|nr:PREDICTED: monosaccharide-sensing protein 2-like [Erythranthe guttata]|eukprot:XP_012833660.1 PREDICTED: monosaccharide-sensing protein 2-like [Erythranthe guttata]
MEGLSVAMSLIGATLITLCSGGISDWLGRRPMLIVSSMFYFVSGVLMLWSPNVYSLLCARLLDGFGIGLAVTFVPLYISEMSPPEIRGVLSTLSQFTYSSGIFLSYSFVFCMSLTESSSWRLMLGVLFAPSLIYFALTLFYLPESPRWLMSKGRVLEARQVLQRLRGTQDVSSQLTSSSSSYYDRSIICELALLVEGLEVGHETAVEEYVIGPPNEVVDEEKQSNEKEEIKVLMAEGISSMVALRLPPGNTSFLSAASLSKQTSVLSIDPVVSLFDTLHDKSDDKLGTTSNSVFATSSYNEHQQPRQHADNEGGYTSDDLRSPLISRQTTGQGNTMMTSSLSGGSSFKTTSQCDHHQSTPASIGGGWQLAWKWKEAGEGSSSSADHNNNNNNNNNNNGDLKRVYLHKDGDGDQNSHNHELVKAGALVSQSALSSCTAKLLTDDHHPALGAAAMIHPCAAAVTKGPNWKDLFEPGVKHALIVGMGIQMVQQFLGINAVLYYTPQILEQAGVQVLLADMGISSTSSSLLISAVMTLLMLPCVVIAMRLMDVSGRRYYFILCSLSLLLNTNPVLTVSLVILVMTRYIEVGSNIGKAAVSTVSVITYSCFFAMGFGPIPNILCAEIFPTRVRGVCIGICGITFWICNIMITYSLPMMLSWIGLGGVFSIFAVASLVSWGFVYLKVPETKGMPLEVITEFFSLGAKPAAAPPNS